MRWVPVLRSPTAAPRTILPAPSSTERLRRARAIRISTRLRSTGHITSRAATSFSGRGHALNGTLNYAGGVIGGAGATLALSAGDVLNVSGGTKEFSGSLLQNGGTINLNLASGNTFQLSNGGTLANTGTINFNDNVGIAPRSGFGPGAFNNAGGMLVVAAGKTGR